MFQTYDRGIVVLINCYIEVKFYQKNNTVPRIVNTINWLPIEQNFQDAESLYTILQDKPLHSLLNLYDQVWNQKIFFVVSILIKINSCHMCIEVYFLRI